MTVTRPHGKTLTTIGGIIAVVASVAGLVAILLGIGGDVAVVRSDVARHETTIAQHGQALHALELGTVVVPARLEELVRRVDDLTRRLERLDAAQPRGTP